VVLARARHVPLAGFFATPRGALVREMGPPPGAARDVL